MITLFVYFKEDLEYYSKWRALKMKGITPKGGSTPKIRERKESVLKQYTYT